MTASASRSPGRLQLHDDGLAYVKDPASISAPRAAPRASPPCPTVQLDAVIEAAEECPGECIFIEAAGPGPDRDTPLAGRSANGLAGRVLEHPVADAGFGGEQAGAGRALRLQLAAQLG